MSPTYKIKGNLVHVILAGEYSVKDVEEVLNAAMSDADYPSNSQLLFDVSQSLSLADRSPQDLRHMANFLARLSPRFGERIAIVAGTKLHYGMMRMAEVYSETSGMSADVFLTIEEALDSLAPNLRTAESKNELDLED